MPSLVMGKLAASLRQASANPQRCERVRVGIPERPQFLAASPRQAFATSQLLASGCGRGFVHAQLGASDCGRGIVHAQLGAAADGEVLCIKWHQIAI